MKQNRRLKAWVWPVLLSFSLTSALPVLADAVADEQEAPALRKPLPALSAPALAEEAAPVFSTEAPPPPPFDPNYQPPGATADTERKP